MKKILLAFLMIASFQAIAQNELTQSEINALINEPTVLQLVNNTKYKIYASFVFFDNTQNSYTSVGWYPVEPYSHYDLPLESYVGFVYIHGENRFLLGNNGNWGADGFFCTNKENFKILYSNKIRCYESDKFSKLYVRSGINKWVFNP